MYSLLIVESPNKVRALEGYLKDAPNGPWRVRATVGHWRGLPAMDGQKFEETVVPERGFEEQFVVQNARVERDLRGAIAGAKQVYLAADPDREGEAIAWHVAQHFGLKSPKRVRFTEITKAAVCSAVGRPEAIDFALVEGQRARQVLDYLFGMEVSRRLWRFGAKSAGRVQSCALHVVAERERQIVAFKAEAFWTVSANYTEGFDASLAEVVAVSEQELDDSGEEPSTKLQPVRFGTKEAADLVAGRLRAALPHVVDKVDSKQVEQRPPAPFTTSSLLATANKLGMSPAKTTDAAQRLFEQGLVTYIRTDSVALAPEAVESIRSYLSEVHPHLVPEKPQKFREKGDAQGAHEAIRPTDIRNKTPAGLEGDTRELYDLIWERTLTSQCASAKLSKTTLVIRPGSEPERLLARGTVVVDPGFLELTRVPQDSELPSVSPGDSVGLNEVLVSEGKTKPPPYFTVQSLIRYLERRGVGRPSTYSSLLTTLMSRGYLCEKKKKLRPEELGMLADELMNSFAKLRHEDFTRKTEAALDKITSGRLDRVSFLGAFYDNLHQLLSASQATFEAFAVANPELDRDARIPHDVPCPACGGEMLRRRGKSGPFAKCEECSKTLDLSPPKAAKSPCPSCKAEVHEKTYRKDGKKKSLFLCSKECGWKSSSAPSKPRKEPCPECGKAVLKRKGKSGDFWSCTGYPTCRYTAEVESKRSKAAPKKKRASRPRAT